VDKHYDVVVIGTGAAGATAAFDLSAGGRKVAIVDSRPFGGTCLLRGCDPKKVLFGAAETVDRVRDIGGISKGVAIEWPELMAFTQAITGPKVQQLEKGFAGAGIDAYHGRAHFVARQALRVGEDVLEAAHVVLANGAKPRPLGIPGEELLTTSDRFLELKALPRSITFIGGGYISFEFAHVAAAANARVRILHRSERLLRHFDQDMVRLLVAAMQERGIEVRTNVSVQAVEKAPSGRLAVRAAGGETFESEAIAHGAGRVPDIADLDAERAGIQLAGHGGIEANEYLQSVSNPAVYAAGDAVGGAIQLTPVAVAHAQVVARNILEGNEVRWDPGPIPSVVYTVPTLAAVGLTEEAARRQGLSFSVNTQDTSSWYTSRRLGLKHTGFKVLVDKDTGRLLGAHLLGPNTDEIINVFALAMRLGIAADRLKSVIWTYPTGTYDISYMI
jgi:glutathione reductase (NADPH)